MKTRLDQFDAEKGLDRGRSKAVEAAWYLLKCVFLLSALPWPSGVKAKLMRAFGAKIGEGVVIKPRVNVHFPWNLEVAEHADWIVASCALLEAAYGPDEPDYSECGERLS